MKKFITKTLSGIMAAAMTVTLLPATALVAKAEETYKYVVMNIPYSDFYAAESEAFGFTSVEEQTATNVDAVTSATTSKYKSTSSLTVGTYYDTTQSTGYIKGVTFPVALTAEQYDALDDTYLYTDSAENNNYVTDVKGNYYFKNYVGDTAPSDYLTLSVDKDGNYSFAVGNATTKSVDGLSIGEFTTTSNYGDYQISVVGVSPAGVINNESTTIYGAYLVDTDNNAYAMYALDNLWYGTRVKNLEIAWSVKNGKEIKRGHGSGDAFYQYDMNGKTLNKVVLITNIGTYTIDNSTTTTLPLSLTKYYDGDLSGVTYAIDNGSKELEISGIPSDIKDAKISLSGNLATNAEITDGKVALNDALVDGTSYTLTISSSNYANITFTLSTPATEAQYTELKKWVDKATATEGYEANDTLKDKVATAKSMLETKSEASYETATFITALKALVKKTYSSMEMTATIVGNAVTITSNVDFASLENPTYTITSGSGRMAKTLASGSLTAYSFTLESDATVDTSYTITVVADNYADSTATATATAKAAEEEKTEEKTEDKNNSNDNQSSTNSDAANNNTNNNNTNNNNTNNDNANNSNANTNSDSNAAAPQTSTTTSKSAQKIKVSTSSKTVKYSKLKKKALSFKISAKAQGKLTFKKKSGSSKISINKTTGKITLKKGLKKGTYKVKINISAAETDSYEAATVTKTIKIKVK